MRRSEDGRGDDEVVGRGDVVAFDLAVQRLA
jgi:hypothetical protein